VRYLGNRSSGRLGIALADEAAGRNWTVTLLLGPTNLLPSDSRVKVRRFLTTADLDGRLKEEAVECDALVMAAAVADYRPRQSQGADEKIKRGGSPLTLELDPTPDLLAGIAAARRPGQLIVGFALEPRSRLMESASAKLVRKGLDLIVANPLETMDAPTIDATVLDAGGVVYQSDGPIEKAEFAARLLDIVEAALHGRLDALEAGKVTRE